MSARWSSRQDDTSKSSNGASDISPPPIDKQNQESPSPKLSDPSPLDDSCARYILSVMVLYIRQTATPETRLMSSSILSLGASFYDFESVDVPSSAPTLDNLYDRDPPPPSSEPPKKTLHPKHSVDSVNSGSTSSSASILVAAGAFTYHKTHMSLLKSSLSMNNHIGRFAGCIVNQLSVANWSVVFHRIRTKVHMLSSTSEDNPDTVDLQLMTHCVMDKSRLIQVLQGNKILTLAMHLLLICPFSSFIITCQYETRDTGRGCLASSESHLELDRPLPSGVQRGASLKGSYGGCSRTHFRSALRHTAGCREVALAYAYYFKLYLLGTIIFWFPSQSLRIRTCWSKS